MLKIIEGRVTTREDVENQINKDKKNSLKVN